MLELTLTFFAPAFDLGKGAGAAFLAGYRSLRRFPKSAKIQFHKILKKSTLQSRYAIKPSLRPSQRIEQSTPQNEMLLSAFSH